MFCKKCGKELTENKVCAEDVFLDVGSHEFDQETGKKWFEIYSGRSHCALARCRKWHHFSTFPKTLEMMKSANISYRKEKYDVGSDFPEYNYRYYVPAEIVKNGQVFIGQCSDLCCLFCGDYNPTKSKREGCFIATVVYSSYKAPEVLILRCFRDEILLPSKLGRIFVNFYYCVSPLIAKLLRYNISLQNIVRKFVLQPIVKLCYLYLRKIWK